MPKRSILIVAFSLFLWSASFAQEEEKDETRKGFKKENLFTGGNIALGFSNGAFQFGLGPYFGYSLNKFIDVAVSINYNYISQRDYYELGDKARQSVIGPGIFTRIYPVKFLFAHAQLEQNFIKFKYFPASNSSIAPFKETESVPSLLLGAGFASGRGDSKSFYYISLMFDVLRNENSPYVDGTGRANPIIRAGYNIALFQGKNRDF
jgi:hypothetical protein